MDTPVIGIVSRYLYIIASFFFCKSPKSTRTLVHFGCIGKMLPVMRQNSTKAAKKKKKKTVSFKSTFSADFCSFSDYVVGEQHQFSSLTEHTISPHGYCLFKRRPEISCEEKTRLNEKAIKGNGERRPAEAAGLRAAARLLRRKTRQQPHTFPHYDATRTASSL